MASSTVMSSVAGDSNKGLVSRLVKVVAVMAAAGALAGALGVGGALIFNPFLLQLGIHPAVGAALLCCSSACLVVHSP